MFLSLVLTLFAPKGIQRKGSMGQVAHSWLMEQLARIYGEQLPAFLHDGANLVRPFTICVLDAPVQATPDPEQPAPAQMFSLRVTSFDAELSSRLAVWRPKTALPGRLGAVVVAATIDSALHPWAASTNLKAMMAIADQNGLKTTLPFEFASPVFFKTGAAIPVPFPAPYLLFQSLASRWNDTIAETSGGQIPEIPDAFLEDVGTSVEVTEFALNSRTVLHRYGSVQKPITGSVGTCTYDFYKCDELTVRIAHLLAHFAFYSGAGALTANGFGQLRLRM